MQQFHDVTIYLLGHICVFMSSSKDLLITNIKPSPPPSFMQMSLVLITLCIIMTLFTAFSSAIFSKNFSAICIIHASLSLYAVSYPYFILIVILRLQLYSKYANNQLYLSKYFQIYFIGIFHTGQCNLKSIIESSILVKRMYPKGIL